MNTKTSRKVRNPARGDV